MDLFKSIRNKATYYIKVIRCFFLFFDDRYCPKLLANYAKGIITLKEANEKTCLRKSFFSKNKTCSCGKYVMGREVKKSQL